MKEKNCYCQDGWTSKERPHEVGGKNCTGYRTVPLPQKRSHMINDLTEPLITETPTTISGFKDKTEVTSSKLNEENEEIPR